MSTLFDAPKAGEKALRPYQITAIEKLDEALFTEKRGNTILSLPPSGGKTFVTTQYCDSRFMSKGMKVLWLAHREELIEQARDDASSYCPGRKVTTWYQGGKDISGDMVVASVPSCRSLMAEIEKTGTKFEVIVVDEAHHAAAETYQNILEGVPHTYRIGLTGTPKRMDGKNFAFNNIAYQIKFMELVEAGWCARPTYIRYRTKQTHMFQVRAGEITPGSLRSLNNSPRNEMVVKEFFDHKEYWPAMVYTVNVEHAWDLKKAFAEGARARGREARVCVVTGETPKDERRQIVADARAGKIDAILNCMCFTEGTDIPTIRSIFLTRPTMSETLYLQMALRGGRSKPGYQATGNDPSPGLDPNNKFYILDFVDSAHHYAAASRGFALRGLDAKQVNKECGLAEDMERAAEILKLVPKAADAFSKKFRGVKYEDEELTPEQWVLSNVGAVLVTSSPFEFERQWVLTAEQDFAVLCGTEYIWDRYDGWRPTPEERNALIDHSYELFGKGKFTPSEWKTIAFAWIGFKRWGQKTQDSNGGRTWLHMSSVESPPLQEIHKVIEEIEKEAEEVDGIFESADDAWYRVRAAILEAAPGDQMSFWSAALERVFNIDWGDIQFSFHYDGSPADDAAWFLEYLIKIHLRRLVGRDDVRVTMSFRNKVYAPCPACNGSLVVRPSARGRFYGCSNYPDCRASAQLMTKEEFVRRLSCVWNITPT